MSNNGVFNGHQNARIFWRSWTIPKPKAMVVVAHGLGEHSGRYEALATRLNQQGLNVYALDHRGHGRSNGRRGDIEHIDFCVQDLATLTRDIVKPEGKPVYLFGHSMGGAIATAYALERQQELAGLILSGPAISSELVNPLLKILCAILNTLSPALPVFKVNPALISRDSDEVQKYSDDPLVLSGAAPVRAIHALVQGVDSMNPRFAELSLPVLLLHGEQDKLAPHQGSRTLFDNAASHDKTLKIYPGFYHEILNELPEDRELVLQDICQWLEARLA